MLNTLPRCRAPFMTLQSWCQTVPWVKRGLAPKLCASLPEGHLQAQSVFLCESPHGAC